MGWCSSRPASTAKLSAEENLVLGGQLFGLSRAAARARAKELLARAGLSDRARDQAGKLSGRHAAAAGAGAGAHPPPVDPRSWTSRRAASTRRPSARPGRRCTRSGADEGLTVLLTTHRPDEAEACDRLAVLAHGRVVASGTPEALRARVPGDVVTIEADDPVALAAEIAARSALRRGRGRTASTSSASAGTSSSRGSWRPSRRDASAPSPLRRPTLGDAFLAITGDELESRFDPDPAVRRSPTLGSERGRLARDRARLRPRRPRACSGGATSPASSASPRASPARSASRSSSGSSSAPAWRAPSACRGRTRRRLPRSSSIPGVVLMVVLFAAIFTTVSVIEDRHARLPAGGAGGARLPRGAGAGEDARLRRGGAHAGGALPRCSRRRPASPTPA